MSGVVSIRHSARYNVVMFLLGYKIKLVALLPGFFEQPARRGQWMVLLYYHSFGIPIHVAI